MRNRITVEWRSEGGWSWRIKEQHFPCHPGLAGGRLSPGREVKDLVAQLAYWTIDVDSDYRVDVTFASGDPDSTVLLAIADVFGPQLVSQVLP